MTTKCTCSNPRHHAKWTLNVSGITKSIENVLKTGDIEKLTKAAYDFVMNIEGFIAHYDHNGFKATYSNVEDLRSQLLESSDVTDNERYVRDSSFSEGEQKDYYAQKRQILQNIKILCERYKAQSNHKENELIGERLAFLNAGIKKALTDIEFAKTFLRKLELL